MTALRTDATCWTRQTLRRRAPNSARRRHRGNDSARHRASIGARFPSTTRLTRSAASSPSLAAPAGGVGLDHDDSDNEDYDYDDRSDDEQSGAADS